MAWGAQPCWYQPSTSTRFDIAKWSGLALLGCYGFAAAHLSGAGTGCSLQHAPAVGAVGAAVILIKALVH